MMTTVRVNRPEKESSLVFIQVRMDQRNTNIRKKKKTPLKLFNGVFSDSNSKPKAVHFDITKKSIIFVLIELYSISILGELLYGSMGPDRYETYHFIPTFY